MIRTVTYLSFMMLLLLAACADEADSSVNQTDEQGRKHGKWVDEYPGGQLRSEVWYEHGVRAGTEKTYFESGSPNTVKVWKPDTLGSVLDGPYLHFYENGNPLLRMTYADGVPVDTIRQYYRSGILDFQGQYDTGMAVGTWEYFDKEGKLKATISHDLYQREFYDELRSGTYTWYDSTGDPVYRGTWYKGQLASDTVFNEALYEAWKEQEKIDLSSKTL